MKAIKEVALTIAIIGIVTLTSFPGNMNVVATTIAAKVPASHTDGGISANAYCESDTCGG